MPEALLEEPPVGEVALETPETQYETNMSFLELAKELGINLTDLYREAVRQEPALAEIKLAQMELDGDNPPVGSARPNWASQSGRHEVQIRTDNGAMAKFDEYVETFDITRQIFADLLGLTVEELTAGKMLEFAFLHELGHTVLYDKYRSNPDKYRQMVKKEKSKLPFPDKSVRFLATDEGKKFVEENWLQIQGRFNVSSYDELLNLQEKLYRNLKQESFADQFAARVMTGRNKRASFLGRLARH